jgi:hypothetical protein
MITKIKIYRKCIPTVLFLTVLALFIVASGCTQLSPQKQQTSEPVTAVQTDNSHIAISFHGGQGMDNLLELEVTVTDSTGKSQTRSIGSRMATTPVTTGTLQAFTGSFSGNDHVFITGYFSDGSRKLLLDTVI